MLSALRLVDAMELRQCLSAVTSITVDDVPDFVDTCPVFDLITDLKHWLKRQQFEMETDSFIHGKHPAPAGQSILVYTLDAHTHCKVVCRTQLAVLIKNTHPDHLMVISPLTSKRSSSDERHSHQLHTHCRHRS